MEVAYAGRGLAYPSRVRRIAEGGSQLHMAPSLVGTGGKRVPSGHNAEGISDPQVGSETSTDHGSGLYDD